MTRSLIKIFSCLLFLSGCVNTYVEEKASLEFEPIYPTQEFDQPNRNVNGSIYAQAGGGLFATDRRASKIGDILTVALSEKFTASKSQSANSAKTDDYDVTLPKILVGSDTAGLFTTGTKQAFAGSGTASQSNSLNGELSVTVTRVFANGNMEILGQKKLLLNNGSEYIRLTGLIRPEDISANNVVASSRIANAKISYLGAGEVADTAKRGWLSSLFSNISPL